MHQVSKARGGGKSLISHLCMHNMHPVRRCRLTSSGRPWVESTWFQPVESATLSFKAVVSDVNLHPYNPAALRCAAQVASHLGHE